MKDGKLQLIGIQHVVYHKNTSSLISALVCLILLQLRKDRKDKRGTWRSCQALKSCLTKAEQMKNWLKSSYHKLQMFCLTNPMFIRFNDLENMWQSIVNLTVMRPNILQFFNLKTLDLACNHNVLLLQMHDRNISNLWTKLSRGFLWMSLYLHHTFASPFCLDFYTLSTCFLLNVLHCSHLVLSEPQGPSLWLSCRHRRRLWRAQTASSSQRCTGERRFSVTTPPSWQAVWAAAATPGQSRGGWV